VLSPIATSHSRSKVLFTSNSQPSGGAVCGPCLQALVAEDLALLTLLGVKYQPGPAMASVLAGAYEEGKLEGVVPPGGGTAALEK